MPKPRKTIEVDRIRTAGNFFLKNSPREATGERIGTANLLEAALLASENYRGFSYLEAIHSDGKLVTLGDETRRHYN